MKWVKSESTVMPEIINKESSKTTVYLRRNIKESKCTDKISGDIMTYYEYEETALTKKEYTEYLKVAEAVNMQQIRADVDYLLILSGDLEVQCMFEKIKIYYDEGFWGIERVRKMVEIGKITEEEFEEITGGKYEEQFLCYSYHTE